MQKLRVEVAVDGIGARFDNSSNASSAEAAISLSASTAKGITKVLYGYVPFSSLLASVKTVEKILNSEKRTQLKSLSLRVSFQGRVAGATTVEFDELDELGELANKIDSTIVLVTAPMYKNDVRTYHQLNSLRATVFEVCDTTSNYVGQL